MRERNGDGDDEQNRRVVALVTALVTAVVAGICLAGCEPAEDEPEREVPGSDDTSTSAAAGETDVDGGDSGTDGASESTSSERSAALANELSTCSLQVADRRELEARGALRWAGRRVAAAGRDGSVTLLEPRGDVDRRIDIWDGAPYEGGPGVVQHRGRRAVDVWNIRRRRGGFDVAWGEYVGAVPMPARISKPQFCGTPRIMFNQWRADHPRRRLHVARVDAQGEMQRERVVCERPLWCQQFEFFGGDIGFLGSYGEHAFTVDEEEPSYPGVGNESPLARIYAAAGDADSNRVLSSPCSPFWSELSVVGGELLAAGVSSSARRDGERPRIRLCDSSSADVRELDDRGPVRELLSTEDGGLLLVGERELRMLRLDDRRQPVGSARTIRDEKIVTATGATVGDRAAVLWWERRGRTGRLQLGMVDPESGSLEPALTLATEEDELRWRLEQSLGESIPSIVWSGPRLFAAWMEGDALRVAIVGCEESSL